MIQKTEGVILHTLKFREYDQIVTLFTEHFGLLKGVYKGGLSHKRNKGATASPLSHVELSFEKGKGELQRINELSIFNHALALRASLESLESACNLAKILLHTQLPGKASPELYQLFVFYLRALPQSSSKELLEASFRLKRLRYDGLFAWGDVCAVCHEPLVSESYQKGEAFCRKHASAGAVFFSAHEREWIGCIAFCRKISELEILKENGVNRPFLEKLKNWERVLQS